MKNIKLLISLLVITTLISCSTTENTATKTAPILTTSAISNITLNTASSGGNVSDDGGDTVTSRGLVWNTAPSPTTSLTSKTSDGSGLGNFSSSISNLLPSNSYFVRAYATNSIGTGYGNELSFTTGAIVLPTLLTTVITSITTNSAISGGNITADGGGTITARGLVWSKTSNPTIALSTKTADGSGTGVFTSSISGLSANTSYFVKAYATNSAGTVYGNEVNFTTQQCNPGATVTDIDGNTYNTIVLGNQIWMKENLDTSKYSNGDPITKFTTLTEWNTTTVGSWSYYDQVVNNLEGKLYNLFAVKDPRGVCPCGYHIPSKEEWTIFENYLTAQGASSGVNPAKSIASKINWSLSTILNTVGNNPNLNNTSNFSGFPTGCLVTNGFRSKGTLANWWLSNGDAPFIYYNYGDINTFPRDKSWGASIRCIKN